MAHDPIHYHWTAAAVPPPYHDEFDILSSDHENVVEYFAGYRSAELQPVRFEFTPDPIPLSELYALLSDLCSHGWIQSDPPRVGGAQEWLHFGERLEIPPDLQPPDDQLAADLFRRVRDLVPQKIWDSIRGLREANGIG
jgi:hypothetical protein